MQTPLPLYIRLPGFQQAWSIQHKKKRCLLGRFLKFFAFYSLAKFSCWNDCTVCHTVLVYRWGSSKCTYLHEKPLQWDLEPWMGALMLIASNASLLSRRFQDYLIIPPRHDGWFARWDCLKLYHALDNTTYNIYTPTRDELLLRCQYLLH